MKSASGNGSDTKSAKGKKSTKTFSSSSLSSTNKDNGAQSFFSFQAPIDRQFCAFLSNNFSLKVQPGDGNCLFHSCSESLKALEIHRSAEELRDLVVEELTKYRTFYQDFVEQSDTSDPTMAFDKYITEIRKDGVWGDELCLRALASSLGLFIFVYEQKEVGKVHRFKYPPKKVTDQVQSINLSRHNQNHFNAIIDGDKEVFGINSTVWNESRESVICEVLELSSEGKLDV